ncbi:hypothetical protein K438DRAFT_1767146 [Mycena galopus ATCC 62051]|nr:hypothetical protein K438DRAFT_1767146 [Mycena galopus ATCC 62051]
MCDTINTSSALSSTTFLISSNIFPYLSLGLVSASFIVYVLQYCCRSAGLDRLNDTITIANCGRDYLALAEINTRFLRTKLTASRLHTRLLEARSFPGWKDYAQTIMAVSLRLPALRREVRDVHTSALVLIEAAHQRKLTEDIKESQETMDAALQSQDSWRARVQHQPHYEV